MIATEVVSGAERLEFQTRSRGGPDVLHESRVLSLLAEPSIQRAPRVATRGYAVGLGQMSARRLVVGSNGPVVRYQFDEPVPYLRFSYLDLPGHWLGRWGWQGSLGYGFKKQGGGDRTVLHLLPLNAELIYRGLWRGGQRVAPFATVGVGNVVFLQRGGSKLNTSESEWVGLAGAGIWWAAGQWLNPESFVPIDLSLSYTRVVGRSSSEADWSGDRWQIALGVSL